MSVNVNSYSKSKEGSGSSGSKLYKSYVTSYQEYATLADKLSHTINLWGHPFDGSKDVDGDFEAIGAWIVRNPYDEKSLARFIPQQTTDTLSRWVWRYCNVELHDGNIKISDSKSTDSLTIDREHIKSTSNLTVEAGGELSLKAPKVNQVYEEGHLDLGLKGDLKAGSIFTNNIYDDGTGQIYVGSPLLLDGGLDLNGDLTVKNLFSQNITNEQEIRTKDMTVTGSLSVFELIIQKISAVGGQLILSAAEFRVDDVEEGRIEVPNEWGFSVVGNGWIDGSYRTKYIYMVAEDSKGQKTDCDWQPFDHIISYTTNLSGKSAIVARSWWTLVLTVETGIKRLIGGEMKECHRLEIVDGITAPRYSTGGLVDTDEVWLNPSWGVVNPVQGDECALLGSQHEARANAIMICANNTIDVRLKAPCIAQYSHIYGFELPEPDTYFARNGNRISGSLVTNSGKDVDDVLTDVVKGRQTYLHRAYADSEDGTLNFSKVKDKEYLYEGLCANMKATDDDLTYEDYIWSAAGNKNTLLPARERLYLADDDNLYLDVEYLITNWTNAQNYIEAEIVTYTGAKTIRKIVDKTNDGRRVRYAGIIQKNWSAVQSRAVQYCAATVYLKDPGGRVLDSRSLQLVMDAGAILSVTDKILMRVGDVEGNISSLVLTSKSIVSRIASIEKSLQVVLTADGANVRLDAIDGRVNDIKLTVDGLVAQLEGGIEYDDGWITQRFASIEAGLAGVRLSLQQISQNSYDDTWIVNKFNDFSIDIDGLKETLKTIEQVGYDDSEILEKISTLEHTIDGLTVRVQKVEQWGDDSQTEEGQLAVLSNRVYARVLANMRETGIDITDGYIKMYAEKTDIIGALNIKATNNSDIIIYDDKDTPTMNITTSKLGGYTENAPTVMGWARNWVYATGSSYDTETGDQPIGNIPDNSDIILDKFSLQMVGVNENANDTGYPVYPSGSASVLVIIKRAGTEVQRYTFDVASHDGYGRYETSNSYRYTAYSGGDYTVSIKLSCVGTVPSGKKAYGSMSVRYQIEGSSMTIFASDGIFIKTGANSQTYIGEDGLVVKNADYIRRLGSDGDYIAQRSFS